MKVKWSEENIQNWAISGFCWKPLGRPQEWCEGRGRTRGEEYIWRKNGSSSCGHNSMPGNKCEGNHWRDDKCEWQARPFGGELFGQKLGKTGPKVVFNNANCKGREWEWRTSCWYRVNDSGLEQYPEVCLAKLGFLLAKLPFHSIEWTSK